MRVFIFEHITGGGLLATGHPPRGSLLREGLAMLTALACDMAAIEGVEATILWDHRLPPVDLPRVRTIDARHGDAERRAFRELAARSDWTIIVAPESGGVLLDHCRAVEEVGGRLLGPTPDLVRLAADKHATAEHLRAAQLPTPQGIALRAGQRPPVDFRYPAVLKPRDGAGSQSIRLITAAQDAAAADVIAALRPMRLEEFCPGRPASVAALGGPAGALLLEPCRQHLSDDGRFTYRGGSLPLAEARRARRLAECVVAALPAFIGYLGIDLVLGSADDGSLDRVIEVNPRLTTSYVGLRAAAEQNLAAVMLDLASGGSPRLAYRPEALEGGLSFDAAGHVRLGSHELARA